MIMNDKIEAVKLLKVEIDDGIGGRETAFKVGTAFRGVFTTKTVKNAVEGGIIEFIPYAIMLYEPTEVTLNYNDCIQLHDGRIFQVMDDPSYRQAPSFSNIKQLQVRVNLIKHFGNAIIK